MAQPNAPVSELTTPGTIVGTLHYMAPEQLEGLATDARTDVFAFGCVLYEMLTGKKAFEGRSSASLMTAIMAREPAPLRELVPSLPNGVEELVTRCLAEEPRRSMAVRRGDPRRIEAHRGPTVRRCESGWYRRSCPTAGSWQRPPSSCVLLLAGGASISRVAAVPAPGRRLRPTTSVQLAVLPLRMVGGATGTAGDEYLGIGIADSIITRLAGVRQIGLRPTAAVLRYADAPADPATVAKALSVGHVLVGTIQRNADTYRITLQLVQSSDGTVSWARSYDVLRSALSNLQDTIAEEVVDALRLELTTQSATAFDGAIPITRKPIAFTCAAARRL